MQPQEYYSSYSQPSRFNASRLVQWLIVLCAVITLLLLGLAYFGYGTVHFAVPDHATVLVNGHRLDSPSARLRTGSYVVTVKSPTNETYESSYRVNIWPSTFKPALEKRQPDAIVSSVIGASGLYGKPGVSDVKWFGDNTWLVGVVGPGSAAPIALHYGNGEWRVGYYTVSGYPQSIASLPPTVGAYVQALGVKYAD